VQLQVSPLEGDSSEFAGLTPTPAVTPAQAGVQYLQAATGGRGARPGAGTTGWKTRRLGLAQARQPEKEKAVRITHRLNHDRLIAGRVAGELLLSLASLAAYQKNCRRVSKMFGSSLTLAPAAELNFELLTAT
jgi:hypothetical protein